MGEPSWWDRFCEFVSRIGWRLFLWGSRYTEESYWELIYIQERERWAAKFADEMVAKGVEYHEHYRPDNNSKYPLS